MTERVLWVCERCSTVLRSEKLPEICDEKQGGCKRSRGPPADPEEYEAKEWTTFLGPFPEGAKDALEIVERYRALRLKDGLTEPQAIETINRERDERPEIIRDILRQSCLLDEWPIGWREEEWPGLAKWMTWEDLEYWLKRLIDSTDTNLFIAMLLAAQGHLAPLLRAIGPAFDVMPIGGRYSAGKSRCAEILTYLGGGRWFASATVAGLKAVRKGDPLILGIDEGDEAERTNPGVKAWLLEAHDWRATNLKFGDADKGKRRELEETEFGGPIFITFRKKPWDAVASRAFTPAMEPSKRAGVSDDGDGEGFRRLLGPGTLFLRRKCEEALADRDDFWAMRRTHQTDFLERLNRVYDKSGATILRQRALARVVLFMAEVLGFDMERVEERITETIAAQELESENATIIEAIESDPLFQLEEVSVEDLRLSVQKFLRDRKEFVDLTRNRFAEVLREMGFSRKKGPTWKRIERDGRKFMAVLPALWRASSVSGVSGMSPLHREYGQTGQTPDALPERGAAVESVDIGPGEAIAVVTDLLRELGGLGPQGAPYEPLLVRARDRGISPDRAMDVLKRLAEEGSLWVQAGHYRLTEGST